MAFKGNIKKSTAVEAELRVDNTATGSALIVIAFDDDGGNSGADSIVVAPSATESVRVATKNEEGHLQIRVDFGSESDPGHLTVRTNGTIKTSEDIQGDTTWSYTIG